MNRNNALVRGANRSARPVTKKSDEGGRGGGGGERGYCGTYESAGSTRV